MEPSSQLPLALPKAPGRSKRWLDRGSLVNGNHGSNHDAAQDAVVKEEG